MISLNRISRLIALFVFVSLGLALFGKSKSYAYCCGDIGCAVCTSNHTVCGEDADKEKCDCSTDCSWVGGHCSGSNCDHSCCGPLPNDPPTCNITGDANLVSGVSEQYASGFSDGDGDSPRSCDWTTTLGTYAAEGCWNATFVAPASSGSSTLSYSASDGKATASCDKNVNIYSCDDLVPTNAIVFGGSYWYMSSSLGDSISEEYINYVTSGPAAIPNFTKSASFTNPSCNALANSSADPLLWNIGQLPGSLAGTTCQLNASISLPSNAAGDSCPPLITHFNAPPVCTGITFASNPINICGSTQITLSGSDVDNGPVTTLSYHVISSCANGGNGTFADSGTNELTTSSTIVTWVPPVNIPTNGTTCTFDLSVSDGLETTSCAQNYNVDLTYNYNLVVDVTAHDISYQEFHVGMCGSGGTPANGVTVNISEPIPLGFDLGIEDGSPDDTSSIPDGVVTFSDLPAPHTPTAVIEYGIVYSPVCAAYHLGCESVNGGVPEFQGTGGQYTGVLDFDPVKCSDNYVSLDLYEAESARWITSIDGDLYSSNLTMAPQCADENYSGAVPLEDGFTASIINFRDILSPINDGFTHISNTYKNDYVCSAASDSSDDSNCGKATEINDLSYWFEDLEVFTVPDHPLVSSVTDITQVDDSGLVRTISAPDFNDAFNNGGDNVVISFDNPGVSVLYVLGDIDLHISKPVVVTGSGANASDHPERLIIIANTDIYVDPSVGYVDAAGDPYYGPDGYSIDAVPNVDMALITSASIIIEGDGEASETSNDLPLMLRGPVIADKIELHRDLWAENDMHPTTSVMYHSRYLSELTSLQRSQCSLDLFGLSLFDVQFNYED